MLEFKILSRAKHEFIAGLHINMNRNSMRILNLRLMTYAQYIVFSPIISFRKYTKRLKGNEGDELWDHDRMCRCLTFDEFPLRMVKNELSTKISSISEMNY